MAEAESMRHHVQGLVLLIVMLLALWVTVAVAGPVVDDALHGENRALKAVTIDPDEVEDPNEEAPIEAPLPAEEVAELQAALIEAGYDPGSIDGQLGPVTRQAADQALVDRDLPETTSDRDLLDILQAEAQPADPGPADIDPDAIGEGVESDTVVEGEFIG